MLQKKVLNFSARTCNWRALASETHLDVVASEALPACVISAYRRSRSPLPSKSDACATPQSISLALRKLMKCSRTKLSVSSISTRSAISCQPCHIGSTSNLYSFQQVRSPTRDYYAGEHCRGRSTRTLSICNAVTSSKGMSVVSNGLIRLRTYKLNASEHT